MAVCADFLNIQLCAYRDICPKDRIAVFITVDDFQETVRRNYRAVCSRQILCGEQTKLHRKNFTVHTDPKFLILR